MSRWQIPLEQTQRMLRSWSRRFPARLRDQRFWLIQALVVAISAGHTGLEAAHTLGNAPDLYLLPVSTYFLPAVYAGLNFGLEGAVPTALWCCLLVAPNIVIFHHGWERMGVVVQLGLMVVIAILIARRVEQETSAKMRAELARARLAELNATAAATSGSLSLDQVLHETVAAILEHGNPRAAWIAYAPGGWDRRQVVAMSGDPRRDIVLAPGWEEATRRSVTGEQGPAGDQGWAVVPVRAGGRTAAALGMALAHGSASTDDRALLAAIAQQIGVALDNIHNYREAQLNLARLAQAQKALESYLEMATAAQEEERRRLARELHDDTTQTLVIAKAQLDSVALEPALPGRARDRLADVRRTLETAIDNVRRFSRDLRPSLLDDLGLVDALDWLVADTSRRVGIDVPLVITGHRQRLESRTELGVYRIVQEALRNIERHAGARRARVRLRFGGSGLTVSIVDDGNGFDVAREMAADAAGLGLRGMHERAKLASGELRVWSRPGRSTCISLRLGPSAVPAASSAV